jgi:hypothetical protein
LLTRIDEAGLELTQMLKLVGADVSSQTEGRQRPEITVQSYKDYFLNQSDRTAWEKIKDSSDPSALQDFIKKFQSSLYYPVASDRLARLTPSLQNIPPKPAPPNAMPSDQSAVTPIPRITMPVAQQPVQPAGPPMDDHVAITKPDAMADTTASDRPDKAEAKPNLVPRIDQAGAGPDRPSAAAGTGIQKGTADPPGAALPGKHGGAKGKSSIRPLSSGDAGSGKAPPQPRQQIANAEKPSRPAAPTTMMGQAF